MAGKADMGIRRVRTASDWRLVRALRFEFADRFDDAPDTTTYLLTSEGAAVGTSRSSVSAPPRRSPLPSHHAFKCELEAAFGTAAVLLEASLTFVDPHAAGDAQEALMRLFKMHMWRCAAEKADALVVAVRESQIGYYRRRFDMEILSGAESVPGMATPRVLMALPWRDHSAALLRRIPMLVASAEDEAAFERL